MGNTSAKKNNLLKITSKENNTEKNERAIRINKIDKDNNIIKENNLNNESASKENRIKTERELDGSTKKPNVLDERKLKINREIKNETNASKSFTDEIYMKAYQKSVDFQAKRALFERLVSQDNENNTGSTIPDKTCRVYEETYKNEKKEILHSTELVRRHTFNSTERKEKALQIKTSFKHTNEDGAHKNNMNALSNSGAFEQNLTKFAKEIGNKQPFKGLAQHQNDVESDVTTKLRSENVNLTPQDEKLNFALESTNNECSGVGESSKMSLSEELGYILCEYLETDDKKGKDYNNLPSEQMKTSRNVAGKVNLELTDELLGKSKEEINKTTKQEKLALAPTAQEKKSKIKYNLGNTINKSKQILRQQLNSDFTKDNNCHSAHTKERNPENIVREKEVVISKEEGRKQLAKLEIDKSENDESVSEHNQQPKTEINKNISCDDNINKYKIFESTTKKLSENPVEDFKSLINPGIQPSSQIYTLKKEAEVIKKEVDKCQGMLDNEQYIYLYEKLMAILFKLNHIENQHDSQVSTAKTSCISFTKNILDKLLDKVYSLD